MFTKTYISLLTHHCITCFTESIQLCGILAVELFPPFKNQPQGIRTALKPVCFKKLIYEAVGYGSMLFNSSVLPMFTPSFNFAINWVAVLPMPDASGATGDVL